jgi:hypothetical protein
VAAANNLAGDDFNRGIRAYYFGLAASGWLLSPLSLAVLSLLILWCSIGATTARRRSTSCARRLEAVTGNRHLAGIGFGLLAYGMWGFFPLFFRQLAHVSPMDVLSNRAVWACVFVGVLLSLRRQWHKVAAVFRSGGTW